MPHHGALLPKERSKDDLSHFQANEPSQKGDSSNCKGGTHQQVFGDMQGTPSLIFYHLLIWTQIKIRNRRKDE